MYIWLKYLDLVSIIVIVIIIINRNIHICERSIQKYFTRRKGAGVPRTYHVYWW